MNKKFLIVFILLFAGMAFAFYKVKTNLPKDDEITSNKSTDEKLIGNISNIELYVTDYKYDKTIPGYNYVKVDLTKEQINELKNNLARVDLNNKMNDIVYGKYKLVIDDKTLFFDIDTDSALYLEDNITFRLSNDIKKIVVNSKDTCSCCTTSQCNINLCACSTD